MNINDGWPDSNPILKGKDAKRFLDNIRKAKPIPEALRKRIKDNYEAILKLTSTNNSKDSPDDG